MNFQGCTTSKKSQKAVRQQNWGSVGFPFAVRRIFWKMPSFFQGLGSKGRFEVDVVCYENPFERFLLGIISTFFGGSLGFYDVRVYPCIGEVEVALLWEIFSNI